ncbi:Polyadenylate-binding protein 2 [Camellia lanceoleosa]|uniref:Polyadenylate-binding protein 2 n=1 Tax=Camellia lanceoleosa TaxID=1840588 RepID=A0ACC0IKY9_9ERIC|nr:Polyadenylate-binding protein 2 [Camellia lanceoleosa]
MGGADQIDDRTFRLNFLGDGAAKLRDRVNEKLKEFMGDYTDDTLVEYVIVLLKNGRCKEEARNELNVFLGDDSDSFVSWLWDHLGSNINLYVQPQESLSDEAAKEKPTTGDQMARNDLHHLDFKSDRGKSSKLSRSRHNREWKTLVRDVDEPPPFQSSVIDNVHTDERTRGKVGHAERSHSPQPVAQKKSGRAEQSHSPQPIARKKRSRPDEHHLMKRGVSSQSTINAPRRLLQFAVRDAVATSRPSNSTSEPSLKHLRSVVSTSAVNSSVEARPRRFQSIARVPNAMATAIKAVEEAAKDVVKNRSSGNVFDRLGRGMDISQASDQLTEFREAAVEDVEYGDFNRVSEETRLNFLPKSEYTGDSVGDVTMLETDTGMASDSASDNERYDDVNVMGHRVMDVSQIGTSGGNEDQDSLMVRYSVAKNSDEIMRKPRKDQDQSALAANTSRKIVNISVNVNTWKPTHYPEPREVSEMDNRKSVQESEAGLGKSGVWLMNEKSNPVTAGNGNTKPAADTQKEPQKMLPTPSGLYSTGRPTEDADSRTIFVNNVHFASTKDSLSRHFNKFGEVLKVIIVTDAATGQPKGSAYVEFMRKDAAENALSLDGTSFMSRILKVVRKSSAQEAAPMMTWPRVVRGSPFAPQRFARVPFPRGISSVYRGRPPIKPGARSMQWKRDAQPTPSESGPTVASGNTVPSPAVRSLTYIRTEPKTNGSSGTA